MKHQPLKQGSYFKIEGGGVKRQRRNCPRCGDGVFLADHKDRFTCGNCHYSETKGNK